RGAVNPPRLLKRNAGRTVDRGAADVRVRDAADLVEGREGATAGGRAAPGERELAGDFEGRAARVDTALQISRKTLRRKHDAQAARPVVGEEGEGLQAGGALGAGAPAARKLGRLRGGGVRFASGGGFGARAGRVERRIAVTRTKRRDVAAPAEREHRDRDDQ